MKDPSQFRAAIKLGGNGPCTKWISEDLEQKKSEMQSMVLEALNNDCSYSVSCIANSTFSCSTDETEANYAYVPKSGHPLFRL